MTRSGERVLPAELPADVVVVGRIGGAYGVRGELRIDPFNAAPESVLRRARRWFIVEPDADRPHPARPCPLPAQLQIRRCRVHAAGLVATAAGVDSREFAEALRGCEVAVSRSEFPGIETDEYYWVDLIGCEVVDLHGVALGRVVAVDDHGAHPLLQLLAEDGRQRLIPFVAAHVPEVDLAGRRIVADWDPDF
ncbi:MAG: ribosome maturation factor RimM [Burkholderiaceae bacterium]